MLKQAIHQSQDNGVEIFYKDFQEAPIVFDR